ncbi:MAG: ligase [Oscillochloris sp.]|nr:ligase [Oscillochloris sp.]
MRLWRQLPTSLGSAQSELASAEALLLGLPATARPALRWYESADRALVIGSGQKLADIDQAACAVAGVRLHRRASGGTAVLFTPGLLMQDIALPAGHSLAIADVSESYRWLGDVWAATLARLGLDATPIAVPAAREDTRSLDPLLRRACFAGRSPYEILADERKLVGFSQLRRRQGILLQVGLYTRWPAVTLASLLQRAPDEAAPLAAGLAARVVGLAELLPAIPAPSTIAAAFAQALAERYGVTLQPTPWHPAEQAAQQAALSRYAAIPIE